MRRRLLKSKLHRATVTACDLNYEGSITIDIDLLERADILEFEQVQVVDINNGARFETYAIAGERGSHEIQVNGAAARLVQPDDLIIVMSFADFAPDEVAGHAPVVIDLSRP
jgi:aspartate 1-decarboxylase